MCLIIDKVNVLFVLFQVTLGTISNVDEAVRWLSYTYLFVRMRSNPLHYGIPLQHLMVCTLNYLHHYLLQAIWCNLKFSHMTLLVLQINKSSSGFPLFI